LLHSPSEYIAYDLAKAKTYKAAYVAEGSSGLGGGASLSVIIPSDTSATSQYKSRSLKEMWNQAGITANSVNEESALIVAKAFNASGNPQNAYDLVRMGSIFSSASSSNDAFYLRNQAFNPSTTSAVVSQLNSVFWGWH
jgi:hypothetical protein